MSTQHTPGPWKMETVPTSCGICHKIGQFPNIRKKLNGEKEPPSYACVYVDNGDGHAEEMLANARLMAAAPELLEALKGVLRIADRQTVEFDAARAAIAKAEGTP